MFDNLVTSKTRLFFGLKQISDNPLVELSGASLVDERNGCLISYADRVFGDRFGTYLTHATDTEAVSPVIISALVGASPRLPA